MRKKVKKKANPNKILDELKSYDPRLESNKSNAFKMLLNRKSKTIPHKKQFNKKAERRKNKIKDF